MEESISGMGQGPLSSLLENPTTSFQGICCQHLPGGGRAGGRSWKRATDFSLHSLWDVRESLPALVVPTKPSGK